MNLQNELYILFLEKYIEDLELIINIERLKTQYSKIDWVVQEKSDEFYSTKKCPKCGIDLGTVMCYTCPNIYCPTGMGPVMSIA